MRKTLIIGATSAIAQACARLFADAGDSLYLVARDNKKLEATAEDLITRGASSVHTKTLNLLDYDRHRGVIEAAINTLDGLDVVLIAHGSLPDQKLCEQSFELTRQEFEVNTLSTISLLTVLADYFEIKGNGAIAVITSVAGDRGRQSNYIYGSAKGALTIFLQGLRNRLYNSGVSVLTIKPGFVDTPMTEAFNKGILWAKPQSIAKDIFVSIHAGKDILYTPRFWRSIMFLIRALPEGVMKRLRL